MTPQPRLTVLKEFATRPFSRYNKLILNLFSPAKRYLLLATRQVGLTL